MTERRKKKRKHMKVAGQATSYASVAPAKVNGYDSTSGSHKNWVPQGPRPALAHQRKPIVGLTLKTIVLGLGQPEQVMGGHTLITIYHPHNETTVIEGRLIRPLPSMVSGDVLVSHVYQGVHRDTPVSLQD